MRRGAWIGIFVVAGSLARVGALSAQVAGTWQIEVNQQPAGQPADAPAGAVVRRAAFPQAGTLDVRVRGDSAFGTWTPTRPSGKAVEMKGAVASGTLTLRSEQEGRMNVNGEVSIIVTMLELELAPSTGGLAGHIRLKTETGARVVGEAAVSGKRGG